MRFGADRNGRALDSGRWRPDGDDDCLARNRRPACWVRRSHEPSTVHLRVPNGSPFHCDSFGGPMAGYDAASFGTRARVARGRPHLRVAEVGGERALHRYAGNRRRMESTSSNHQCHPSGPCAGSPWIPSGLRRDFVGYRAPSGATGRRMDPPFGVEPSHPRNPSGFRGHAAEALPSGCAGATRDRSFRFLRDTRSDGTGNAEAFGPSRSRDRRAPLLRAGSRASDARSQTKPKHFAFPTTFGSGDATRARSHGETSSWSGRRGNARQHRNVST